MLTSQTTKPSTPPQNNDALVAEDLAPDTTDSGRSGRVLIVSSQTGGGHRSAAKALEESLHRLHLKMPSKGMAKGKAFSVKVAHRILEESHWMTRAFAGVYNHMLRHHQDKMKHYYQWIESLNLHNQPLIIQSSLRYGQQLVEKFRPDAVVSVHPMMQYLFSKILRRLNWADKVPLLTVLTDPGKQTWQGWACPDVERYYVPNMMARDYLLAQGITSERIEIAGMPIHSRFKPIGSLEEKHQLRQKLNLDASRFTILVNAGWIGGGNVPKLLKTILENPQPNWQVIYLAGQNTDLYHEAEQWAKRTPIPVRVLGYQTNVDEWMQASDVMVSKLGGLTTFEALGCRLPILADCLTTPMPQEADTADLLELSGAGLKIYSPEHCLDVLGELAVPENIDAQESYSQQLIQMQNETSRLILPGASDRIAESILQYAS